MFVGVDTLFEGFVLFCSNQQPISPKMPPSTAPSSGKPTFSRETISRPILKDAVVRGKIWLTDSPRVRTFAKQLTTIALEMIQLRYCDSLRQETEDEDRCEHSN